MSHIEKARQMAPEYTTIRQWIHRHPELGFEEQETSTLVAAKLRELGYDVTEGVGGTGVVATLKRGNSTRSIGLRADMDALPIREAPGRAYCSVHDGKMHACGHDGHTATLLCGADYIARHADFDGTVHLIFQPAEETLDGARKMIEDGLFERFPCDTVYAMHNAPGLPVGQAVCLEGPITASSDRATVRIRGKGGHGAMPHLTRDPVLAAAALVMSLQSIVARNVSPDETAVISVGAIHTGETFNVIPDEAVVKLNTRACTPEVRNQLEERINGVVAGVCATYEVSFEIEFEHCIGVLVNHPEPTAVSRKVLTKLLGEQNVITVKRKGGLGSEDFATMAEARPGCYIALGNGVGTFGGCSVHNPGYDFNDEIIPIGAGFWGALVETVLAPA
ncbi:M20 aminoacylase family protein [Massilia putida]|uniref:M20 aminoacylase family protein n=1 Tax=Massilia putida TaxID=1141883 RepID=UPI000950C9B0|nr:M20 aminoacylase family protein [Massilia putida]